MARHAFVGVSGFFRVTHAGVRCTPLAFDSDRAAARSEECGTSVPRELLELRSQAAIH